MEKYEENPNNQFFCYLNKDIVRPIKGTGSLIVKKLPGTVPHYTLYGFDHRDGVHHANGNLAISIVKHLNFIAQAVTKQEYPHVGLQFYSHTEHKVPNREQKTLGKSFNHTGYVRLHFESDSHSETCSGVFITNRIIMTASECIKFTGHYHNTTGHVPQLFIYHRSRKTFVHKTFKIMNGHYTHYRFLAVDDPERVRPVCIPDTNHISSKNIIIPGYDATPIRDAFSSLEPYVSFEKRIIYTECSQSQSVESNSFIEDSRNQNLICNEDPQQPCVDNRGGPLVSIIGAQPVLEGYSFFDTIPCQGPFHATHYLFKDAPGFHQFVSKLVKNQTGEEILTCRKQVMEKFEGKPDQARPLIRLSMYLIHVSCVIVILRFLKESLRRWNGKRITSDKENAVYYFEAALTAVYFIYYFVEGF